ncbi:response regulator transcription factor [Oceanobacillus picturae]|jgi:DNA-binding response OmpR family regulator|uniref:response regulator transcription factor n=1 Tax=Oceanobacillus picturae TaxID=171693 RepID=UPI00362EAA49
MANEQNQLTILIIEDDEHINNVIFKALSQENLLCTQAFSGSEGMIHVTQHDYDLVILDLMLPGLSGESFIQQLRTELQSDIPVIVLSAKDKLDNKLSLFALGADDYITKPFEIEELLARIHVHVKRKGINKPVTSYQHKNLILHANTRSVEVNSTKLSLTKQEYQILEVLLKNKSRVFTKQDLYELAWEDHYIGEDKTITVHISNIRNKLKQCDKESYIETVWGIGFRLSP